MIEFVLQDTAALPRSVELVMGLIVGLLVIGLVAGFYWFLLGAE